MNKPMDIRDAEETAEFLLYHMPMDVRRRFMAERPVLYARITGASTEAVIDVVRERINSERQ